MCLFPLRPPVVTRAQAWLGPPPPLCRGAVVGGRRLKRDRGGLEGEGSQACAAGQELTSRFLSSAHPQESISSSGTPHKRDSFIYSTWLEDSVSTTSGGSSPGTTSGGSSPGTSATLAVGGGQGWAQRAESTSHAPGGGDVTQETAGGSLSNLR